ncbi:CoA transferase [Gemmobacter sp.]|uniref:CoA transferase n=1 Tax=Gemmobacter sp. TaxID=1898957 RepID=UPI002AFE5485|nr:CoA transferase [Gemmobacter sp.]
MTYGFLNGLRVVESAAFIAAPLAGLTLAQSGADVIRVDQIGGGLDYPRMPRMRGGRSLYWAGLNKGKRSVAVDLRRPEGRELVQALVCAPGPKGGVLLSNIASAWLDHAVLQARRADVITCLVQGNPDGGTALDYTVHSATGYPLMTGDAPHGQPVNHVLPAWDLLCAQQAAMAIATAAFRRRETGQGAAIRLALSDVAFTTLSHLGLLAEAELTDEDRPRLGNHVYGAFGRDFATADGQRLMIVAITPGQWRALVAACGMADPIAALEARTGLDFRDEVQRFEAREHIAVLVGAWVADRTMDQAAAGLDAHRVCWGRYGTVRDLVTGDPRVSTTNPVFERHETPGIGGHVAAGSALRWEGEPRRPTRPAPLLGADTEAVLSEVLGLSGAALGGLYDRGVVADATRDPLVSGRKTA